MFTRSLSFISELFTGTQAQYQKPYGGLIAAALTLQYQHLSPLYRHYKELLH